MNFKTTLIWINALVFIAYGLGFVFFPSTLGLLVTGSAPSTSSGVIDMRATYGGMTLGLGVLFGLLARDPRTVRLGVWGIIVVMICIAGGRVFGMIQDGTPNSIMYIYLAAEILMVILASWALRQNTSK